jgi:molecular chaperone DnaK
MDAAGSTEIETAIAESKTALAGSDVDAMNNAFERLQTASHKLAEVLYSQAGAAGGSEEPGAEQASSASAGAEGDGGSTTASDDNVIDAEYVDVEDEDKS